MSKKHPSVPWYGAPTTEESVQAQAMLDALSMDPSAHIGSLEDTSSAPSSAVPTKTSTPTCSEQIQSLIKEISTNVQFLQDQQPKSKKWYGGASTSSGGVTSTSKMHAQQITELAKSSEVPLPIPPPLPQPEEEPCETLPYETADPEEDTADVSEPSATSRPQTPSDQAVAWASFLAPSDLRQWNFAVSQKGHLVSRHAKPKVQNPMTPSTIASIITPELGSPPEAHLPLKLESHLPIRRLK